MKRSEKRAFCYAEIQITPPAPLPSPHLRDRDGVLYRDRNTRGRFCCVHGDLNLLGSYEKAIRADMAIGEEYQSGITDQYYDLDSAIVQEQILYHGQK